MKQFKTLKTCFKCSALVPDFQVELFSIGREKKIPLSSKTPAEIPLVNEST